MRDDTLTFYTHPISRGRVTRWMLEETGLPYEEVIMDYGTTMKGADYLAINPMGKVPALRHAGVVITEGAAICTHLADLVPHKALSRDPLGNALVMVVNAESKVEARPVQVAQSLGSDWVVTSGLAAGERIIVEGLQKIRPGATVQAQEAGASPPAAGQAPAAKAS